MKKLLCMLSLSGLIATSCPVTAAEESAAEGNGFYAGIGTGRLDFDFNGVDFRTPAGAIVRGSLLNIDVDSKPPLRLSGGYNWGGWAFEVAYEHMLGSADMEIGTDRLDFDYGNFTLGGVYRGAGRLYLLGKFGISLPDIESNTPGTRLSMGNTAYAGAGLGYRFTPSISLEFDFTHTSDDMSTFVLGLRKHF
jgi:hypothetical protein